MPYPPHVTDDEIRAHPAFSALLTGRRLDQIVTPASFALFITGAFWVMREPATWKWVALAVISVANRGFEFWHNKSVERLLSAISDQPETRQRAWLLVKPNADKRFWRLLP